MQLHINPGIDGDPSNHEHVSNQEIQSRKKAEEMDGWVASINQAASCSPWYGYICAWPLEEESPGLDFGLQEPEKRYRRSLARERLVGN